MDAKENNINSKLNTCMHREYCRYIKKRLADQDKKMLKLKEKLEWDGMDDRVLEEENTRLRKALWTIANGSVTARLIAKEALEK